MTSTLSMLDFLRRSAASIALLNVVTMISLLVAYVWHHRLKPHLAHRRSHQVAFERLIARTSLDNHSMVCEPSDDAPAFHHP